MKQVLITGAAGFLGSHLAMHHLNKGDTVIGVDNFCSSDPNSKHLEKLRSFRSFSLHNVNITDRQELFASLKSVMTNASKRIDLAYNFACPASPPRYQAIPVETVMTCVAGTKNVIDYVLLDGAPGAIIVHASTSEVYGDPTKSPQVETDWGNVNSYGVRSCYDEGKRCAEALCRDYLNVYHCDVRLVRIFNTYGPHMQPDDGRVMTNFITQAASNQNMTVYGDGTQTRSFCYVSDLIRGITSLATLPHNPWTPVNIGNPREFTMLELANVVKQMFPGSTSSIVFENLPSDDPRQRKPDISLANYLLGWRPTISLQDGVLALADHWYNDGTISMRPMVA